MKINQVEQTIGITKKNIRFYEEEGLLNPSRATNGYRNYSPEDLETLRRIKLFRKLDIPIGEIRLLLHNDLTLEDCLHRHLTTLQHRRDNLEAMESFCRSILEQGGDLQNMNAEELLLAIERQEKGGIHFVDIRKGDKRRQKKNAVIAAMTMILLMSPGIILPIWVRSIDPNVPWALVIVIALLDGALIIGTLLALKERIKEIEGGELDEASKY